LRILQGAFGIGSPVNNSSAQVDPRAQAPALYAYHEGELFTPGTGNFVFETNFELPVKTLRGGGGANQGTPYPINRWPVFGAPQVYSYPTVTIGGLGGLQAGAFVQQPLLDDNSDNG
jgi:hypothetical protein